MYILNQIYDLEIVGFFGSLFVLKHVLMLFSVKKVNVIFSHIQTLLSLFCLYFNHDLMSINIAIVYYIFDTGSILQTLFEHSIQMTDIIFMSHHLTSLYLLKDNVIVIQIFKLLEISNISLVGVYYLRKSSLFNKHMYLIQFLWYSYYRLICTLPYIAYAYQEYNFEGKCLIGLLYVGSIFWSASICLQWITCVRKKKLT